MTERAWFAPKTYGYGAGLPIAWQGWAVLIGFLAGLAASVVLLDGVARPVAITALLFALVFICWKTTDGGWRWRWPR
ncbi:MAG: hypothetical protein Q8N10_20610 [Phenylobacterium sp.]|uniref:hypothetical protein n=1 Tax=Phenylobacterium sp. TaxID=1871053 RepID=UPI0027169AA2|nr:hypothetical protein [Phenylobacterium sp.]MDO8914445.1 hypothetical protein [Phenylobacterium sp.]MDP2010400.1 hypothetical protein [Phenylobacterium sp.]MDP3102896.1 hypothetical protein [Phenylobacterium sp.]